MFTFLFQSTVFNKPQRTYVTVSKAEEFTEKAMKFLTTRKEPVIWPLLNLDDIEEIRAAFSNKDGVCIEEKGLSQIHPDKRVTLNLRYKGINTEVAEISMDNMQNLVLYTSIGKLVLPNNVKFYFRE